eukprot:TRINITY_DN6097_c0_g3_i3.p1 TRINITY_DN6097_c0_g3~~TRINITY_DN6097_c0_g3_i3.p1  ORF type:complete len:186 (+),score=26.42 TRINITY_DN6097_c0_g3_i3:382-939(+)
MLRRVLPDSLLAIAERGNCTTYTSSGLERGGFVTTTSMWPKSIWINMFENSKDEYDKGNVHVVSYRQIQHGKLLYGVRARAIRAVAPLQSLRSLFYWNLEKFAHAVVEVPEASTEAVVTLQENPMPPSPLRNIVNNKWFVLTSVTATMLLLGRQFRKIRTRGGDVDLLARLRSQWRARMERDRRK